jgi:6-pyruvoyltetrahydropterin/6-carboxytetrahydropterin synthase
MPGAPEPEGSLHAHDYRVEILIERAELDARGMVCDLDVLDAALRAVADEVRDTDLERIRPHGVEAVTVEVFAKWVHERLSEPVRVAGGQVLTVRVWESAVAFGGYQARL